jgi:hypothetical protein
VEHWTDVVRKDKKHMPRNAYKFETEVLPGGKLELTVPVSAGSRVEVIVITHGTSDDFEDLVDAAKSSTDFWDNPMDDADWNNA